MDNQWLLLTVPGPACEINSAGLIRQKTLYTRSVTQQNQLRIPYIKTGTEYRYLKFANPKTGERQNHYIHQLVARHFLPNPRKSKHVRHKNGDRGNNHVANLEWV